MTFPSVSVTFGQIVMAKKRAVDIPGGVERRLGPVHDFLVRRFGGWPEPETPRCGRTSANRGSEQEITGIHWPTAGDPG
jgi:hypothetical protein